MGFDRFLLKGLQHLAWRTGLRRQIRRSGPWTQRVIDPVYRKVISDIVSGLRQICPNKYTDADPFKIIHVNPNEIIFETRTPFRHRGWVIEGNWDRDLKRIDDSQLYKSLKRRFIDGESWVTCEYVEYVQTQITSSGNAWDLSSKQHIRERCSDLDDLWESMRLKGYKSQMELIKENPQKTFEKNVDTIHPRLNEVGVDIGRNGELIWNRVGHHRLILAKLLEINSIPVYIYRRHKKWQDLRDEVANHDHPIDGLSHPDLNDIIN